MQIFNCYVPNWFTGVDIVMELLFVIITLTIAFFAFKAYKIIKQREVALFGIAFLSIALGYFQQILFNFYRFYGVSRTTLVPVVGEVALRINIGFFVNLLHIIFFIAGLSLLVYLTVPKRNKKLFFLIVGLSMIGLFTSTNIMITSFLMSSLLLLTLTLHYYQILERRKVESALYNFIGFGAIFLGLVQFTFANTVPLLYIMGHITTLFGYYMLWLNLYKVLKNGKKKK